MPPLAGVTCKPEKHDAVLTFRNKEQQGGAIHIWQAALINASIQSDPHSETTVIRLCIP